MVTIRDDKKPTLLVPDNGPISALSSIRCLDWLLLPGIPVKITDQVADEATRNPDLPWARETCEWIVRNVVAERISIAYTDTGFDYREQFDAWVSGGMDPQRRPRSRNLGEASILGLMRSLSDEWQGENKAVVLLDERFARKAVATIEANIDLVSTRAFFRLLTEDYGLNDTAVYWRLVLNNIEDMDTLDEVRIIRVP
jgi:hypothetical protein